MALYFVGLLWTFDLIWVVFTHFLRPQFFWIHSFWELGIITPAFSALSSLGFSKLIQWLGLSDYTHFSQMLYGHYRANKPFRVLKIGLTPHFMLHMHKDLLSGSIAQHFFSSQRTFILHMHFVACEEFSGLLVWVVLLTTAITV